MAEVPNNPELAGAIRASAERLGIDPVDLATTISYETGSTFDPWQKGPTTKWGTHRGLIQFGEPQQQKYGVYEGQSAPEQMNAVENYLRDAGVKPGHGLLDIYSAVNSGRVGRPNASDEAAGGAPGTVADKVAGMAPHRVRAELLLNGKLPPGYGSPAPPTAPQQQASAQQASAPMSMAPPDASDEQFAGLLELAKQHAAAAQEQPQMPSALSLLQLGSMPMIDRRRFRGGVA